MFYDGREFPDPSLFADSPPLCHYRGCKVLQTIPEEDIRFVSYKNAIANRYRLCPECNVAESMLRKELEEVKKFVKENNYQMKLSMDKLYIKSKLSDWCILFSGNGRCHLNHKNKFGAKPKEGNRIPGYHNQHFSASTIVEQLQYIKEHDTWRLKNQTLPKFVPKEVSSPKGSKKWHKNNKRQKRRLKEYNTRSTLLMINAMSDKPQAKLVINEEVIPL